MTATTHIRLLDDVEELADVCRLFARIWPSSDGHSPTTVGLLRAFSLTGNYVAGAFEDGKLIGAAVAFMGLDKHGISLFSNQIAVDPEAASGGMGLAIKHHQRQWAIERGISEITWTFDPLMARNAYFFIHKVGARAVNFLPNLYGDDYDQDGSASDRVLAKWDLKQTGAARVWVQSLPVALHMDDCGRPQRGSIRTDQGNGFMMQVPPDIMMTRQHDLPLAHQWRAEVRLALATAMAAGHQIVDVTRDGWYTVAKNSVKR